VIELTDDAGVLTTSTSSSDLSLLSTELVDSKLESFNSVLVSSTVTGEQEGGSRRFDLERRPSPHLRGDLRFFSHNQR
jgi:hypothetical protein